MGEKIAYIMSRFPNIPETFILREMIEIEGNGWEVALYPLIFQQQNITHKEATPWISRVRLLPFISISVLTANIRTLFQSPLTYCSIWWYIFKGNITSLNFLIRGIILLPKAVYAADIMQQEKISHIHAHYASHPALVAWIIHKLTGISYSVTVHAHDIFVRTAMLKTKLKDADFIVSISLYNRKYLAKIVGPWVRDKIHIIHCGILQDYYAPREKVFNQKSMFEIISIGSLQPYKGYSYLIKACVLLRDKDIIFRVRIVGSGEEYSALKKLITEEQLESSIELLGALAQDEVAQILPEVDCYIQPSIITPSGKMEGIPVSLMEALACELPVVATDLSGIPELVRPGETGYLVPPADATALADALIAVYTHPEKAVRMAVEGRKLVLKEFQLKSNVKRLALLFKEAVQT